MTLTFPCKHSFEAPRSWVRTHRPTAAEFTCAYRGQERQDCHPAEDYRGVPYGQLLHVSAPQQRSNAGMPPNESISKKPLMLY